MANLKEIVAFLDQELGIQDIPDYPGALNGLQLENLGEVSKVGAAVDASLPVFEKAIAAGIDLLIVHHGMFWQGAQPVTDANYRKLKLAMDAGMAVYSAHIPLDVHPEWGNNAILAKAIGMESPESFFPWKGIHLGVTETLDISFEDLSKRLADALGTPVHTCAGGSEAAGRVGVITGGAGSEVAAIKAEGIDTFITGEGPHWSYPLAEELGINVIYGGHYATETFGVKALSEVLSIQFALEWAFIDHPTGL